ncbi:unnamed protein product [Phytophthora fragariaefolia]|uniref:Unnamed protein product n=1 Tax=Phytophthora fragariaefolia TaxID=1490495 RepID=A0A9W6U4F1_9STRA|nr:unnamed protein product [Phytophthora fragariaefolia]
MTHNHSITSNSAGIFTQPLPLKEIVNDHKCVSLTHLLGSNQVPVGTSRNTMGTKHSTHRLHSHGHRDSHPDSSQHSTGESCASPRDDKARTHASCGPTESTKAFNGVRSTFKEYDKEGRGYIVYDDLPAIYKELGVSFTEDEINQVFEESDMKENGKLSFKELLISLAIGFLLHVRSC